MRSAHAFATAACVGAPDLQTGDAQLLDDPARQSQAPGQAGAYK